MVSKQALIWEMLIHTINDQSLMLLIKKLISFVFKQDLTANLGIFESLMLEQ